METNTILVGLLAQTDALFEPIRGWNNRKRNAAVAHARELYCDTGLPISLGGGDASERKAAERSLDAIAESGMVTVRRRRGKRIAWRLTSAADWQLRRQCTWSDFPAMLTCMLAIDAHERSSNREPEGNMVPETFLIGGDYGSSPLYGRLLAVLEESLAPALCRDWVDAWSDQEGRVAYSLTPEGRAFLRDPRPPAIDWPAYDTTVNDIYLAALDAARVALDGLDAPANLCCIPLSCGMWPEDTEAAAIPPVFCRGRTKIRNTPSMLAAIRKAQVE